MCACMIAVKAPSPAPSMAEEEQEVKSEMGGPVGGEGDMSMMSDYGVESSQGKKFPRSNAHNYQKLTSFKQQQLSETHHQAPPSQAPPPLPKAKAKPEVFPRPTLLAVSSQENLAKASVPQLQSALLPQRRRETPKPLLSPSRTSVKLTREPSVTQSSRLHARSTRNSSV